MADSSSLKKDNKFCYVDSSDIHGMGLFAKKKIKKGTIIGELQYKKAKKDGPYVLHVGRKGLKSVEVVCDLKYINHSRKPNAVYYDDLTVVALRDIKKGEEITHFYGEGWD